MKKRYLILSNLMLLVLILLLFETTLAYFSHRTEITHTLTAGNVAIKLSEAAVKPDDVGNLVEDTEADRIVGSKTETFHHYGRVYPGQMIFKDPTIENTGTQDAWTAVIITMTDGAGDLHKVLGYDHYDGLDLTWILDGGIFTERIHVGVWNGHENVWYNDHFAMVQKPNRAEGTYDFCFFFNKPMKSGDTLTVFDTLMIPAYWDNEQLQELRDFKMTIRAFAVQVNGLESCHEAMTIAFPDYFVH